MGNNYHKVFHFNHISDHKNISEKVQCRSPCNLLKSDLKKGPFKTKSFY